MQANDKLRHPDEKQLKKPYLPPRLVKYGTIERLTAGIHSLRKDSNGTFTLARRSPPP
jgi:hypothetical protein